MVNNKRLDIELMRIISAFFVIFHHTGRGGFPFFLDTMYIAGNIGVIFLYRYFADYRFLCFL